MSCDGGHLGFSIGIKNSSLVKDIPMIVLNQILRRQTSRSHYGSKVPAVTVTVFKYRNKIGKIVVKAVPYSVT
jgi:hypothetical protein